MNSTQVRGFQIAWPVDTDERLAIGSVLDDVDDEIAALKQLLSNTLQIKQGMMQELLSGRTRLVASEAAA